MLLCCCVTIHDVQLLGRRTTVNVGDRTWRSKWKSDVRLCYVQQALKGLRASQDSTVLHCTGIDLDKHCISASDTPFPISPAPSTSPPNKLITSILLVFQHQLITHRLVVDNVSLAALMIPHHTMPAHRTKRDSTVEAYSFL